MKLYVFTLSCNFKNSLYLAENVQAIYDVWFVRDQFLGDIYQEMQNLRQKARMTKTQPPYLYDYYNVLGYYSPRSSGNRRAIGRIPNSLIVGLNTREHLPHLVVIVIDKDIIEDIGIYNNPYLAEEVIADNLAWLFKQVEMLI